MKALMVVESQFGNTRSIAEAVAAGLGETASVEIVDVDDAPATLPEDLDLLLVGGPTHTFTMSHERTRAEAHAEHGSSTGIREWLDALPETRGLRVATFDTKQGHTRLSGSAARAAARAGRHHGLDVQESESFYVADKTGPLEEGELDRATAWGRTLAG